KLSPHNMLWSRHAKTKYPHRLEIGLLHSDGLGSVAAWGEDCAASLGRVTYTASSRLERSSSAAREYGAPARWRPKRGEIATAKTWVKRTGPAMPVTARRELMAPCSLP